MYTRQHRRRSQPASDLQSLPSQSCDFPALRLLLLSLSLLCGKDGSLYWKITWFSPLTACCMLGKFKTHMRDLAQKNYLHLMDIFAAYCIVMSFWQAQPFIRLPTLLASCPEYCCNIICDWLSFYHALLHRGNSFFFFFFFFLINLQWLAAICYSVSMCTGDGQDTEKEGRKVCKGKSSTAWLKLKRVCFFYRLVLRSAFPDVPAAWTRFLSSLCFLPCLLPATLQREQIHPSQLYLPFPALNQERSLRKAPLWV